MEEIPPEISLKISQELEEKIEELSKYLRDKQESQDKIGAIQIYRHQLAISLILVNVHQKSPFTLVKSHYNLAEGYFQADYFEAAAEHLTSALKLNMSLFELIKESQNFHISILTLLGKCYTNIGKIEDSLEILQKALESNQNMNGELDISNGPILSALSKTYFKLKEYKKSLESIERAWAVYEGKFGSKHEIMIEIYSDMEDIHKHQGDAKSAVEVIKKKIHLLKELEIENDFLAESYEKFGLWMAEGFSYPLAIDAFREAEKIYIQNNGIISKKASKIKRKICNILVKTEEYDEAIKECKELEEIDKSLYGELSNQHGKDLKAIGTILMLLSLNQEALKYFNKASEIYTRTKNKKMLKEVREKIETLRKGREEDINN